MPRHLTPAEPPEVECDRCAGTGRINVYGMRGHRDGIEHGVTWDERCPACDGEGVVAPEDCDDERGPTTWEPEPPENGPDEALERRGVVPQGDL